MAEIDEDADDKALLEYIASQPDLDEEDKQIVAHLKQLYGIKPPAPKMYEEEQKLNKIPGGRVGKMAKDVLDAANPIAPALEFYGKGLEMAGNGIDAGLSKIPGVRETVSNLEGGLAKGVGMAQNGLEMGSEALGSDTVGGKLLSADRALLGMLPKTVGEGATLAFDPFKAGKAGLGKLAKKVEDLGIYIKQNPVKSEEAVRKVFRKLGKYGEEGSAVLDEPGREQRYLRELEAHQAKTAEIKTKLANNEKLIADTEKGLSEVDPKIADKQLNMDLGYIGEDLNDHLKLTTEAKRLPLASQATANMKLAAKYPAVSAEPIITEAKKIQESLKGVLSESKDAAVNKVINQYAGLGDEVAESSGQLALDPLFNKPVFLPSQKTVKTFEQVTPEQLLKDRGVLGKLRKDLLAAGGRDTSQSNAVRQLQEIIDKHIEKAISGKGSKSLLASIKENRNGWADFYKEQYGKTPNALRNSDPSKVAASIYETHDTVSDSKVALGDKGFELANSWMKQGLDRKLEQSKAPLKLLDEWKAEKNGWLERFLSPEEVRKVEAKAGALAVRQQNVETLGKALNDRTAFSKEMLAAREHPLGRVAERSGDKSRRVWSEMMPDQRSKGKTQTQIGLFGAIGVGPALAMTGHVTPALLVELGSVIAIAPEKIARLYINSGPATRSIVEKAVSAQAKLGKLSTASKGAWAINKLKQVMKDEEARPAKPKETPAQLQAVSQNRLDEDGFDLNNPIEPPVRQ